MANITKMRIMSFGWFDFLWMFSKFYIINSCFSFPPNILVQKFINLKIFRIFWSICYLNDKFNHSNSILSLSLSRKAWVQDFVSGLISVLARFLNDSKDFYFVYINNSSFTIKISIFCNYTRHLKFSSLISPGYS